MTAIAELSAEHPRRALHRLSKCESNWAPTLPDRKFEVLFRLCGPQQPDRDIDQPAI